MNATGVTAGPAESNGRLLLGLWRDSLHVTCGLTACTPGSALGPTLGNEYGKTLPFLPHSMRSSIYVMVGRPSVPSFNSHYSMQQVCCLASCGLDTSIDSSGRRRRCSNGTAAWRRSAGNAGSVMLTAELMRLNTTFCHSRPSHFHTSVP